MTRKELEKPLMKRFQFEKVPNVTTEMLEFNGSAKDIEIIGYFFYENVLPDVFPDSRKCGTLYSRKSIHVTIWGQMD